MKHIGIVYNPHIPAAEDLARQLTAVAQARGVRVQLLPAGQGAAIRSADWAGLEMVVTLGGDGTIVRVARRAAPLGVPIVGVNLGRLGFLTELSPQEARQALPCYIDGACWVEERTMLAVEVPDGAAAGPALTDGSEEPVRPSYLALNDMLVGRGRRVRLIGLAVSVDGIRLAEYRGDGVLVSTPTGSTAYSYSAGGPVLHPELANLVVTPVLPHLAPARSVVLPPRAEVEVKARTDHEAVLSVDGQIDIPLRDGAAIKVSGAPCSCRFLRCRPRTYFYQNLISRLHRSP